MTLSFHIRHEVRPERMSEVIDCIVADLSYDHVIQGRRQVSRLRQLGLLDGSSVSREAKILRALAKENDVVWGEVFHYLHYTSWSEAEPTVNGFSWLYRQFSDYLWDVRSILIDSSLLDPAVSFFINRVEDTPLFQAGELQNAVVSLSPDSLRGALHFLEVLAPPVIERNYFQRRHFCHPMPTLLATTWVAEKSEAEIGIDMLLTPERREAICRLCLLEPSALDQTLDWMLPVYPHIVEPGTTSGIYGRFLRFHKWPDLSDLATAEP